MREIKFRGINRMGKMVYGTGIFKDKVNTWLLSHDDSKPLAYGFDEYIIQEDSIMQYTGLKDVNGKEIYEGDIVEYFSQYAIGYGVKKYVVNYTQDGEWALGNHWLLSRKWRYCEVIGNKFENPELLKEVE